MRTYIFTAITSLIVGTAIGATGFDVLHAQSKPPAYVITEFSEVTDGQALGVARDKMMAAVANSGGKVLIRTNSIASLDGTSPKVFAVISFDGVDQAKTWFGSDAMKESNEARHKASTSRVFMVEGLTK
jgi:uncharacterized protein (DUF1330 family)